MFKSSCISGCSKHSATTNVDEVKALLGQLTADLRAFKTQLQETRQDLRKDIHVIETKLQDTRQELSQVVWSTETKIRNTRQKLEKEIESGEMKLNNVHHKFKRDLLATERKLQNTFQELRKDPGSAETQLRETRQGLRDLGSDETDQNTTTQHEFWNAGQPRLTREFLLLTDLFNVELLPYRYLGADGDQNQLGGG